MMSRWGGRFQKHDNSTDRLREWDSDKGEGGPKYKKFADVIEIWLFKQPLARVGLNWDKIPQARYEMNDLHDRTRKYHAIPGLGIAPKKIPRHSKGRKSPSPPLGNAFPLSCHPLTTPLITAFQCSSFRRSTDPKS